MRASDRVSDVACRDWAAHQAILLRLIVLDERAIWHGANENGVTSLQKVLHLSRYGDILVVGKIAWQRRPARSGLLLDSRIRQEVAMEALIILGILASLIVFDFLAIRFGADSRIYDNSRPNWW